MTGGEAKYRELRAKINGQTVSNTQQGEDTPDVYHPTPDPFATEVEAAAGIFMPVELFAVIESAIRHSQGLGVDQHRDNIARLYSSFSEIASRNPHAWSQDVVPADEIRNAGGKNAMLAFPLHQKTQQPVECKPGGSDYCLLICQGKSTGAGQQPLDVSCRSCAIAPRGLPGTATTITQPSRHRHGR
ncbi:MAG: hypothetical protein IPK95_08505 [Cellvibrionales bacterium]|nr:hypothetical protein [Cellvibrionales bacterium]